MSDIRVTYSGLISFGIGLIAMVTGLVFTLIITRSVSVEEYGTWSVIGSMIAYFLISDVVIAFWAIRQVARGEKVGSTAITTTLALSFMVIPVYVLLSDFVSNQSNANYEILVFSSILLPFYFVSQSLNSISQGHQPHFVSYGLIVSEIVKIPTALYFVYFLDMGVIGIIYAIIIAFSARIVTQLYLSRNLLRDKIKLSEIKRWFKLGWLPIYSSLTNVYLPLDVILFPIIVGNVAGVAVYQISYVISSIIMKAGIVSSSLYPKLIMKGTKNHIQDNFGLLLYFAVPLLGTAILFAKPALFAFNPTYVGASVIVILLAFKMFFLTINRVFIIILQGIETVDIERNLSFSKLRKSKLFFAPTVRNVQVITYLIVLSIMLMLSSDLEMMEIVTWWALLSMISEIPVFAFFFVNVKRHAGFSFPYRDLAKYTLGIAGFVLVFAITSDSIIVYENKIFQFLPRLFLQFVICGATYLGITYLIDKKTRHLFKAIIQELRVKK